LFSLAQAKNKDQFFCLFSLRFASKIFSSLHFLQLQVCVTGTVYTESSVVDPHNFYTAQSPHSDPEPARRCITWVEPEPQRDAARLRWLQP
jgi:hypothetical protein